MRFFKLKFGLAPPPQMKNALSQELTNTVPRTHENGQTYINEMSRLVFKDAKSRLILCRLTN